MNTGEQQGSHAPGGGGSARSEKAGRLALPLRAADRRRRREGRRAAAARVVAEERVARERRRLAADVHDLVMQDLSFALATVRSIAHDPSRASERAPAAAAAAERALVAAREIVGELGERELEPVSERVEQGARQAARGVPLSFGVELDDGARADAPTADALVHIAREAVTNAVKHGSARSLSVSLEHGEEWRLHVSDDGQGFDVARTSEGFGLSSMRLQAEALGGSLRLRSEPGRGTEVEVALP